MYVPSSSATAPEARPSRPSVRFTALVHAAMTMNTNTRNTIMPSQAGPGARFHVVMSRAKDRFVEPGVMPEASGNCSSSTPKISAAASWPTSFAVLFSPRLRPLYSLMKSSAKPSAPMARVRKSTSRPEAEGPAPVWKKPMACEPK